MMVKVLVTGTSSFGVGEGLLKTIQMSCFREQIKLLGASNSELTAYKQLVDKYYVLPNAVNDLYLQKLNDIIEKENVDIIIPGSEAEVSVLARNRGYFRKVDLWMNDTDIAAVFNDKKTAHQFFLKNNLPTPKVYEDDMSVKFPAIVKPVDGKSSEGIYITHNKNQLDCVEYTVSVINTSGYELEVFIMKRILSKGATQYAVVEMDDRILEIAKRVHEYMQNELIINIQLMKKDGRYYIIEINPRFSGSSPIRALMGFNEFDVLFSQKFMKQKFKYTIKEGYYCIRGYAEFLYHI